MYTKVKLTEPKLKRNTFHIGCIILNDKQKEMDGRLEIAIRHIFFTSEKLIGQLISPVRKISLCSGQDIDPRVEVLKRKFGLDQFLFIYRVYYVN